MTAATEILRIIITGIVAIVPSAKDTDLTRLIAPNKVHMTKAHPMVPDHYAFLDIPEANYQPVKGERAPDFHYYDRMHKNDRVVFLLHSEMVELESAPTNLTHEMNPARPANPTKPKNDDEKTSPIYEVQMGNVCPKCGKINNKYFDIAGHPEMVAARMDLHGGYESVNELHHYNQVWKIGPNVEQPVAQEVVYKFDVPAGERLVLTSYRERDRGTKTYISVRQNNTSAIDVTFGNSPLGGIMYLGEEYPTPKEMYNDYADHHFVLLYDVFARPPRNRPVPVLKTPRGPFRGMNPYVDDCVPGVMPVQDPTMSRPSKH